MFKAPRVGAFFVWAKLLYRGNRKIEKHQNMHRINSHLMGIDQGDIQLFSHFENDGPMWVGNGAREARKKLRFSEKFQTIPVVKIGFSMWDVDQSTNARMEIVAENITKSGFEAVFKTWSDTRVARVRASWIAIGELPDDENWDLY